MTTTIGMGWMDATPVSTNELRGTVAGALWNMLRQYVRPWEGADAPNAVANATPDTARHVLHRAITNSEHRSRERFQCIHDRAAITVTELLRARDEPKAPDAASASDTVYHVPLEAITRHELH
jgi:hypothetical protein